jgi:hypothetical protein
MMILEQQMEKIALAAPEELVDDPVRTTSS